MSERYCPCVSDHVPNPKVLHKHHIIPKSWGGTDALPAVYSSGEGEPTNLVALCPTAHENVHRLLNEYLRNGLAEPDWFTVRRYFTTTERWMAKTAWDWWVEQHGEGMKPPWTLGQNQGDDTIDVA